VKIAPHGQYAYDTRSRVTKRPHFTGVTNGVHVIRFGWVQLALDHDDPERLLPFQKVLCGIPLVCARALGKYRSSRRSRKHEECAHDREIFQRVNNVAHSVRSSRHIPEIMYI
jgi:hypothetical protein